MSNSIKSYNIYYYLEFRQLILQYLIHNHRENELIQRIRIFIIILLFLNIGAVSKFKATKAFELLTEIL
jgi:hypothetical protein